MLKKKLMIVDDSALMRRIVSDIINADSRFEVVKTCVNGLEAFENVSKDPSEYDAILLDINLPKMNGIEFLEAVKQLNLKAKVIIISSNLTSDSDQTINALELGALDYVSKPENLFDFKSDNFKDRLIEKLSLATGIIGIPESETVEITAPRAFQIKTPVKEEKKSETRTSDQIKADTGSTSKVSQQKPADTVTPVALKLPSEGGRVVSPMNVRDILSNVTGRRLPYKPLGDKANKIVLIASSTGGPKALQEVIPLLPKNINAPVIVVQHMSSGFTKPLAERLNNASKLTVNETADGMVLKKGNAYIAMGGSQVRLKKRGSEYVFDVNREEPPRFALKPCADILFESVVDLDFDEIICCVLTGMGGDGTMGIHYLSQRKNCLVIAQDEKTSTVYGMPKVVYDAGLTDIVVPIGEIAQEISNYTGVK